MLTQQDQKSETLLLASASIQVAWAHVPILYWERPHRTSGGNRLLTAWQRTPHTTCGAWAIYKLLASICEGLHAVSAWVWVRGPSFWCPSIRVPARMEPLEGPPVSSPDPAIISSVEQQASSSTHAVADMLSGSPSVMTHTPQLEPGLHPTDILSDPPKSGTRLLKLTRLLPLRPQAPLLPKRNSDITSPPHVPPDR